MSYVFVYTIISIFWFMFFLNEYNHAKKGHKRFSKYYSGEMMRLSAIAILLTPVWPLAVIGFMLYNIYRNIKTVPEIVSVALGRKSQ